MREQNKYSIEFCRLSQIFRLMRSHSSRCSRINNTADLGRIVSDQMRTDNGLKR